MSKSVLFVIIFLFISIGIYAEISSSSINWLSKNRADSLYCQRGGDCIINNLTITGDAINMTTINQNETGNLTVMQNIFLGGYIQAFNGDYYNTTAELDNVFLSLSGGNANQDIDIGVYDLTATEFTSTSIGDEQILHSQNGLIVGDQDFKWSSDNLEIKGDIECSGYAEINDITIGRFSSNEIISDTGTIDFDDDNLITTENVTANMFRSETNITLALGDGSKLHIDSNSTYISIWAE